MLMINYSILLKVNQCFLLYISINKIEFIEKEIELMHTALKQWEFNEQQLKGAQT